MKLYNLIDIKDEKYVYDAYTDTLKKIDLDFYNILKKQEESPLFYEKTKKYQMRNLYETPDFICYQQIKDDYNYEYKKNNTQKILVLSITERCNMFCEYCCYNDQNYIAAPRNNEMTEEIMKKAIDLFYNHSKYSEIVAISFYGGEPLLRKDFVKKSVEYAYETNLGQIIQFTITTNGLLLDDMEFVDFMVKNNFIITVSYDGPECLHDRYRKTRDGKATYNVITKNLKKIADKYPDFFKSNFRFNVVVAPPYNISLLYSFFKDLDASYLDIRMTDRFREYLKHQYGETEFQKESTVDNISLKMQVDYVAQFKRYTFIGKTSTPNVGLGCSFCNPAERKIFVNCSGKIYICERVDEKDDNYCIGDVWTGIDERKISSLWEKTSKKIKDNCFHCWAIRLCKSCFVHEDKIEFNGEYCKNMRRKLQDELQQYLLLNENVECKLILDNVTLD